MKKISNLFSYITLVLLLGLAWGVRGVLAQGPTPKIEFLRQIGGDITDVAIENHYAYVGTGSQIIIFDISRSAHPVIVGQSNTLFEYLRRVAVVENTPYLVVLADDLHIVDVSNPAAPNIVGFYKAWDWTQNIAVAGNYLYVAAGFDGLRMLNIANPTHPVEVGFHDITAFSGGLAVTGNYAYVGGYNVGFNIVDISNPSAPTQVGFHYTPHAVNDIVVAGNHAYTSHWSGLRIADVSNPAVPNEINVHFIHGGSYEVVVKGNIAYVATGFEVDLLTGEISRGGLQVIDISDPTTPKDIDFYDTSGAAVNLAVTGNYVYIVDTDDGLVVLWFAQPVTASIFGGGGALISSADKTTYTFPTSVFTDPVVITHTARFPAKAPSPGNLIGIDHFFDTTAVYSSTGQPAQLATDQNYTLAVQYTEAEKGPAIEDTLALYYWNGNQWLKEASSMVDPAANTVTAQPNHWATLWAVLGETRRTFLPVILDK